MPVESLPWTSVGWYWGTSGLGAGAYAKVHQLYIKLLEVWFFPVPSRPLLTTPYRNQLWQNLTGSRKLISVLVQSGAWLIQK